MCCIHINILFLLKSPYIGLQLPATQVQAYMAQLTMILLVCFKVSYLILIPFMSFLLRDIKGISKNNSLDSLSQHSTGQPREMVYELPGYGWIEIACIVWIVCRLWLIDDLATLVTKLWLRKQRKLRNVDKDYWRVQGEVAKEEGTRR